jgi:hypothetical protein
MPELTIPSEYLDAAPIIVTSPTTRCGTTLVQRLLCASDNAFVYGEEIGHQLQTLTRLFTSQIHLCDSRGEVIDDDFARALGGVLNDWRPSLAPPTHVLLSGWTDTYFQIPQALARFGAAIDRPIWGFKWPGCPIDIASAIMTLMPRARMIYVVRNLVDALMSAKARRFVTNDEQAYGFCAQWAYNMDAVLNLPQDGRVLILPYELLLDRREEQLDLIGAFTGVRGLRTDVFQVKVNTYPGEAANGHSPTQYIEPHPLTEAERAMVFEKAGALMTAYYPGA